MEILKNLVTKIEELNEIKSKLMSISHFSFKDIFIEILTNYKQIASTEDEINKKIKDNKIQLKPSEELIKIYSYDFNFEKYQNRLSQLHDIISEDVILEIHKYYKNLKFLQNLSKELLGEFNKLSKIDKSDDEDLLRLNMNSDPHRRFKVKYKDYLEFEKRTRVIGSSLIKQLNTIGKSQPSWLLVRNEFEYTIENTEEIRFIFRKLFNTLNKKIDGCNTSINFNYRAKELDFIGYLDIDRKSNFDLKLDKEIKDKITGENLVPFLNVKPIDNDSSLYDYNFGVNCNTDFDLNDFYWIEIHARIKKAIEKIKGKYFTRLFMTFGDNFYSTISVKIPNQKEGIFRTNLTEITKAAPSPNLTYDDSLNKVFVWHLDNVYPNQKYRIDLYFTQRIKYTPLFKSLFWMFVGAVITILCSYFITF